MGTLKISCTENLWAVRDSIQSTISKQQGAKPCTPSLGDIRFLHCYYRNFKQHSRGAQVQYTEFDGLNHNSASLLSLIPSRQNTILGVSNKTGPFNLPCIVALVSFQLPLYLKSGRENYENIGSLVLENGLSYE